VITFAEDGFTGIGPHRRARADLMAVRLWEPRRRRCTT
jgi:hypothetical protein